MLSIFCDNDNEIKHFSINNINDVFKLPINYLDNKTVLEKNIHTDLELKELKDNSCNCIYDNIFDANNQFSKITTQLWSNEFTTNVDFLKDSQFLYKSIKNVKKINNESIDNIIKIYDEIKNDYSFKDRYNYVEWKFLERFNKSSLFLLILSILNISTPIFSLIIPFIILLIPFFLLKITGRSINFIDYISLLSKLGRFLPLLNILNFQSMTIDKKIMTCISIVIYFFSLYQNILSVFRFYKNMRIIHEYINDIRDFTETSIQNMNNFLMFSSHLKSYSKFNNEIEKYKLHLIDFHTNLSEILPYRFSIRKLLDIGNVMKNFYTIYNERQINDALLFSFGFYGYLENIISLQNNIHNSYMSVCKFSNKKMVFKKSYYAPLKNKEPVTNDFALNKNIIITGPNAAGKTTILKSTLLNIILSQQIGCGFYKSATVIPFDHIHCYLNIPDTSNRDSLFQAEARRCKDILDIIHKDNKGKHFCIFDELYSGTNPYEAVASAYSYLSYLSVNKNIKFMLTTHYVDLCKRLSKYQNKTITNKHMKVNKNNQGDFTFTYKMINNISEIKGGIKVLKDLDYPSKIIESTENIINKLNVIS